MHYSNHMIFCKLSMISDVNFMKFGRLIRSQYFNFYLIQRFQIKRETVSDTFLFIFFCIMVILLSLIFLNTL